MGYSSQQIANLTAQLIQLYRRSRAALAALVSVAILCGACSSSVVSTGPTPVKCQVSLAASSSMTAAEGGTGTLSVTTPPECAWDVSTSAGWISGLSPTSGQGNGKVEFRVAPNPQPSMREGEIVVNESRMRVQQQASPCQFEIRPTTVTMNADGGTRDIDISARTGCSWTASADANWVSFTTPVSGSGNGTVTVRVARNRDDGRRTAMIRVADQVSTLTQSGESQQCQFGISPTSQNIAATGGSGAAVTVSTDSGCDWTANSNASWISVTSGSTGSGDGTVRFSVAVNLLGARTGTISIADRTFTVSQAGVLSPTCSYVINPTSQSIAAGGGSGSASVTSATGCAWTAVSNAGWITVASGGSGSGNGSVSFNVAANTGATRNGTLTIGGSTFTVMQAAAAGPACTYSLSPTSGSVAAGGGSGTFAVTSATGCGWTASSGAAWITVTSGASGSGNGSVAFSAAANTGAARSGTITVAGQTYTVSQAAPAASCSYSISPSSASVSASGGSGSSTVSTDAGCAWTASSNAAWITVTSGASGNGSGSVGFSIAPNLIGARTGTLTIAGQTFTVTQAAVVQVCTYSVSPTTVSVGGPGGSRTVGVTAGTGCAWTAVSNATWITVTSGASGSGSGSVSFSVEANGGRGSVDRTGTLTVAGQTVTVQQGH